MAELFQIVLQMSLMASVVALAAILLRGAFRRLRLPAFLCVVLWLVVLLRMVLPLGVFTSSFSLMGWAESRVTAAFQADASEVRAGGAAAPSAPGLTVPYDSASPLSPVHAEENAARDPAASPSGPAPSAPARGIDALTAVSWVWLAGALGVWGYALFSWLIFRLRLTTAVYHGEGSGRWWESDRISAPFVMGFFPPKIYVPKGVSGETLEWVLLHERTHVRLGHHWMKPLFFLVLAVHWFNPVLWLAWVFYSRDLEFLCDEEVLRRSGGGRKAYSAALLSLAAPGPLLPPSFGENGVKARVKQALRWRRPTRWAAAVGAALAVLMVVCLAADPVKESAGWEAPALTVSLGTESVQADRSAPEDAPWPEKLPSALLTAGESSPFLSLRLDTAQSGGPDRAACTEYLIRNGAAAAPVELPLAGDFSADGTCYLSLPARDGSSSGREDRLLVLSCAWERGGEVRQVEYALRVALPLPENGNTPLITADSWPVTLAAQPDRAGAMSLPYGTRLTLTTPAGGNGYCDLYASLLDPRTDAGAYRTENLLFSAGFRDEASREYTLPLAPLEAAEGAYPDQRQYYTLVCTRENGEIETYYFCIDAYRPAPEVDAEGLRIRYFGDEDWTDLRPLLSGEEAQVPLTGEETLLAGSAPKFCAAFFTDGRTGWLIRSSGAQGADCVVCRTLDGGYTWEALEVPLPEDFTGALTDVAAGSAYEGYGFYLTFRQPDGWLCQAALGLGGYWRVTCLDVNDPEHAPLDYLPWPAQLPEGEYYTTQRGGQDLVTLVSLSADRNTALFSFDAELTGLDGLLFCRGGRLTYFPELRWNGETVHLYAADYDADEMEEVAAVFCTGSGGGELTDRISVFEQDREIAPRLTLADTLERSGLSGRELAGLGLSAQGLPEGARAGDRFQIRQEDGLLKAVLGVTAPGAPGEEPGTLTLDAVYAGGRLRLENGVYHQN